MVFGTAPTAAALTIEVVLAATLDELSAIAAARGAFVEVLSARRRHHNAAQRIC